MPHEFTLLKGLLTELDAQAFFEVLLIKLLFGKGKAIIPAIGGDHGEGGVDFPHLFRIPLPIVRMVMLDKSTMTYLDFFQGRPFRKVEGFYGPLKFFKFHRQPRTWVWVAVQL